MQVFSKVIKQTDNAGRLWRSSVSPGGQLKALKVESKQLGNSVICFMMSTTGQINTEKKSDFFFFFALFFLSNGSSHISGRPRPRPVKKKVPIAKKPGKAINFKRTLSHSGNQTEEVCEALDETLIASLLSAWPFADPPPTPLKGARGLRWPALGSRWSKVGVM